MRRDGARGGQSRLEPRLVLGDVDEARGGQQPVAQWLGLGLGLGLGLALGLGLGLAFG